MAAGTSLPPSRQGIDRDPDHIPLSGRRRRPIGPSVPRAEEVLAHDRSDARADAGDAYGAGQQQQMWPGLPRGVEFNPNDHDLLWHLAAEVGHGLAHRHPFISEFIVPVDDDKGFSCTHPQDIPGVRLDGRASYFFHKRLDVFCNNQNGKNVNWQKVGTPSSVILDGTLQGCKEEFALYASDMSDSSPQQTEWRLHQYHIRNGAKDEGELVVSKIFHQLQNNLCELAEKTHPQFELACKDILDCTEMDVLDHMSLQERYKILLAEKSSCAATTSAGKSVMDVGTTGTTPKRNHGEALYREDICSMLQEISSAPPIIENMDDDNGERLLREDLSDTQMPSMECFVASNLNQRPCSSNNSELPTNLTCGSDDNQLAVTKNGTSLVDVKLEPELEGCEIDSSGSLQGISHHSSEYIGLEGAGSVPGHASEDSKTEKLPHLGDFVDNALETCKSISAEASCQDKNIHGEHSVPFLGIKSELIEADLLGFCENSSINTTEHVIEKNHTQNLDHDGSIAFHSHQQKKRRTASCSSDKTLEEDAHTNVEGIAYSSRRRRRRKTATYDACVACALDEDAPGLLQVLMDKGITVEEIKLYGAGEDDEMVPDCTENNFEDLENLITKLFSQRTSLLKLIVLERPEYGYATYFFEIVQSVPIEWQVGEDLTEGEARVLEEYGWIRNCGLGTMLNYRDRVVHDRWTEKSVAEWRMKIGKLLMTGYAEGQTITSHLPNKLGDLLEGTGDIEIDIKLEDPI
ncbi:hypothetical protein PR202_gb19067 [Eleusine coracana subsp. coracana]|uniref:NAC domain-containing protein n=1 Tax=Eleusine coracana subsp. coracana TaxID=191504 RepID=A0AAV5F515_ELECO|nr:hypothetical protein PR202_gb19067 [Eleusine coracana subsp. coracana]